MAQRRTWKGPYRAISLLICAALLLSPDLVLARPDATSPAQSDHAIPRPLAAQSLQMVNVPVVQEQANDQELQLVPGWNLIALPVQPTNTAPATVLSSIAGKYRRVHTYEGCDTTDPWKLYDPVAPVPANDLTTIDAGLGFWVEMTATATLDVPGTPPTVTSFQLCPGWNLIGYSLAMPLPVSEALAPIADKYTRVFAHDVADTVDPWAIFDVGVPAWANDVQTLEPGHGYWIYITEATTLTLASPVTPTPTLTPTSSPTPTTAPTVTPTPVGDAPFVAFSNVDEGARITSRTSITGIVASSTLQEWRLEYGAADELTWTTIATGTTPVSGTLGTFDPTLLLNGSYDLQLVVTDVSGREASTMVDVVVEGDQKIGNFTIAFTDLEIPVAGIPIEVIRTYDSRDKRQGEFGVGWTLSLNGVRVQENGILGQNWAFKRDFVTFCVEPAKKHLVTFTFAGGKVYKFEPVLTPACQGFQLPPEVTISFRALPGTNATLEPLTESALVLDKGNGRIHLLDPDTLDPIDPSAYILTLADDRKLHIDQEAGVQRIIDTNGNELSITRGGVTHSSGKAVSFTRDAQNRITQVTDPRGNKITYEYDARGDLVTVTDQVDNITRFSYNASHGLLEIIDPRGVQAVRNEYDADGRLVAVIGPDGKRTAFTHDLDARREVIRDRLGNTTIYLYDESGNVLSQTDALGNTATFTYDDRSNKLSETNALSQTTRYTYDERDNMLTLISALGNGTSYAYTAQNQVLSTTDALGYSTINTYDLKGNIVATNDASGNTTRYTYNTSGLPIAITDALGKVTRYEYDASGNVTKEIDALGHATTYTYDANGNRLSETRTRSIAGQGETLTTRYEYDARNRLVTTIYADGSSSRTEYNSLGEQSATIDQLGRTTRYTYDDFGRLVRTTHPDGKTEESAYDAEGRRISSTDRAGRVTSYTYDALGRLTKTTYPDGSTTTTTYNALGQSVATTDALGNTTRYEYDAVGRQTKVFDALNQATTYTYDANGNQLSFTDPRGNTTSYTYDANNRRTKVTYPDTTTQNTAYDALGRRTSQTDQAGKTTQYVYDELGQLTQVVDALGQITRYTYDELGNQTAQIDANNRTTQFTYDALGRRITRVLPLGMTERYTYNTAGELTSKTNFSGKTTSYTYDTIGRLVQKTPDASLNEPAVKFTYTASGQRASMIDASGTTTYTYDLHDRLLSKGTPWGTLSYTYDVAGSLRSIRSSNANGVSVAYAYDTLNRLISVKDNNLADGTTTYRYDENGNLAEYTYPNDVRTAYTYNRLNRLTEVHVSQLVVGLAHYNYALGPAGNRLSVTELDGRTASYVYDDLYRLTRETITDDQNNKNGMIGYTYDAVGNRLTRSSTLAEVPTDSYAYDANDRLTRDSYDADGNTVAANGHTYTYDFENHLVSMDGGSVRFVYDGDGNRVAKTVNGITTHYLVDDRNLTGYAQVLEEIEDGAVKRVYTYGHDLISQRQSLNSIWEVTFYIYDGHGTVRLLSDNAGTIKSNYTFDAFGTLLYRSNDASNDYLFAGEQFDKEIGFYYLRARYLNPNVGRFQTMDTFSGVVFEPMSLHRYLYANANPVMNVDPSGLFSMPEVSISIGISAALNVTIGVFKGETSLGAIGRNIIVGALEGLVGLGASAIAIKAFIRLGRYIPVASLARSISNTFSKVTALSPGMAPGTSFPLQFVFKTAAGKVRVSSGLNGTEVTGAMKHMVNELIKKSGAAGQTQLAEALALQELEEVIVLAMQQGIKHDAKMIITTGFAKWEVVFETIGHEIPKLKHFQPIAIF